jgi:hypothetical protein
LCQAEKSDQAQNVDAAVGTATVGAGPLTSADWPTRQSG